MGKQILAAEISHENAPLYVRDVLKGIEENVRSSVRRSKNPLEEVFIFSTPNRFIIYGVGNSIDPLLNFFLQDHRLFQYVHFYKTSEASINHLFAIATGLYSSLKGEHQVIDQLECALRLPSNATSIGLVMENLLKQAIRIGKKVRTETGIDMFGASVVECALEVIYKELNQVYERDFVVTGTGVMTDLTLSSMSREGIRNITLVGSDDLAVQKLAAKYSVNHIPATLLSERLKTADVILVTSPMDGISMANVAGFIPVVSAEKKVIIDFVSPATFPSTFKRNNSVALYHLDDLKAMQANPLDMFGGVEEAWRMVGRESKLFFQHFSQLQMVPVLTSHWSKLSYRRNRAESMRMKISKIARDIRRSSDIPVQETLVITGDVRVDPGIEKMETIMACRNMAITVNESLN